MLDIASLIYTKLQTDWTETTPISFAEIAWKYDEFDPKDPKLQVLLEIGLSKSLFITRDVYKIEQVCIIRIFIRPVNYLATTIATFKTVFLALKTEIDRILAPRFGVTGIYSVEKLGWKDEPIEVGRDSKGKGKEPIVFVSEAQIKCIYYEGVYA